MRCDTIMVSQGCPLANRSTLHGHWSGAFRGDGALEGTVKREAGQSRDSRRVRSS